MSLESEIAQYLSDDVTISGLSPEIRLEWSDQNTSGKRIVLTRISGSIEPGLDITDRWQRCRLQIDCFDDSYSGMKALSQAVIDAFFGYQGTLGAYRIDSVGLDNEQDLSEIEGDFIDRRVSLDFSILYQ